MTVGELIMRLENLSNDLPVFLRDGAGYLLDNFWVELDISEEDHKVVIINGEII